MAASAAAECAEMAYNNYVNHKEWPMEETCDKCVACAPSVDASHKHEFEFPEDYECLCAYDSFPKRCGGYMPELEKDFP